MQSMSIIGLPDPLVVGLRANGSNADLTGRDIHLLDEVPHESVRETIERLASSKRKDVEANKLDAFAAYELGKYAGALAVFHLASHRVNEALSALGEADLQFRRFAILFGPVGHSFSPYVAMNYYNLALVRVIEGSKDSAIEMVAEGCVKLDETPTNKRDSDYRTVAAAFQVLQKALLSAV